MDILERVKLVLPRDELMEKQFLSLFSNFGELNNREVVFSLPDKDFVPIGSIGFYDNVSIPKAVFECEQSVIEIEISNKTGEIKKSPHKYTQIELSDFLNRIEAINTKRLDHIGFNIPWFDGVAPEILQLREKMSDKSLYYLWPTGEYWDFILPGEKKEIASRTENNLSLDRSPKIEIVSFVKCSTPLIQIDFSIEEKFETIVKMFPEGLEDPYPKNTWVYIKNNFGIDICFVVGEDQGEWVEYLKGHRYLGS